MLCGWNKLYYLLNREAVGLAKASAGRVFNCLKSVLKNNNDMQKIISFNFLTIIGMVVSSLLCLSSTIYEWELEQEKDGIKVYTRYVEGSKLKEFKATTQINAPLQTMIDLLKDGDNMKDWYAGCSETRLVKKVSENEIFVYSRVPAPWPVKDRDNVSLMKFEQQADGSMLVSLHGQPDYIPVKSSCVRMPYLKGFWQLKSIDAHTTQVTHQVHADSGGMIPAWLANSSAVEIPFYTFKKLHKKFNE